MAVGGPLILPSLQEILTEQARRMPLAQFVREGWHVLEPTTPLQNNWHIDAICMHVQALLEAWRVAAAGGPVPRVQNLLVNVPPGLAKSRIVSVHSPAWMWLRSPAWRSIHISANPRVALRDSMLCRALVGSDWYQQRFRPTWRISDNQDAKGWYKNTAGGSRMAFGVGSKVTGDRADALFPDDPLDARDANSKRKRDACNEWYDTAAANRLNDLRIGLRIAIMQRLHEEDFSGHVLQEGCWAQLCLPQEYEPERATTTWIGWRDPRTVAGELLFSARFTRAVLAAERRRLGSAGYAGQHQQRPAPATGNMLLRTWWKRWRELPAKFSYTWQSWDLAQTDGEQSSWVVGQLWGAAGADFYLLDQVRAHMTPLGQENAIVDASARWAQRFKAPRAILIENKASGASVIERVKMRGLRGVLGINPKVSKEERVAGVAPTIEAGNVWIPDGDVVGCVWVGEFVEECAAVPKGAANDQVDTLSQALAFAAKQAGKTRQHAPMAPNVGFQEHGYTL